MKSVFSLVSSALILLAVAFSGCTAPLKSADPRERMAALEKISSDDDLFLIAMDLTLVTRSRGSFCDAVLLSESYSGDVKTAAVKRLKSLPALVRCAAWPDGELYCHEAVETGEITVDGRTYWTRNAESLLQHRVRPGDDVRRTAADRLAEPDVFARLVQTLASFTVQDGVQKRPSGDRAIRQAFFPGRVSYSVGSPENSFVDCYTRVKADNPLERVFTEAVGRQTSQSLLADFVFAAVASNGLMVYPAAVDAALQKLDGSDRTAIGRAFAAVSAADILPRERRAFCVTWAWKLLDTLPEPPEEMAAACLRIGYGSEAPVQGAEREHINQIAERRIGSAAWGTCYLEGRFEGYPREKIAGNITEESVAAEVLIRARSISPDVTDVLLKRITRPDLLRTVKQDCYLQIVFDKTDDALFARTYAEQVEAAVALREPVPRALAAHACRVKLARASSVPPEEKVRAYQQLDPCIRAGVRALEAEGERRAAITFSLCGFYIGMPEAHALFLRAVKFAESEISWVLDETDLVVQLEFAPAMLMKAYPFPADTFDEWIASFAKVSGYTFTSTHIRDEKKPIGGRGTVIKVSQAAWVCKNHRANATLTYFGEKQVREESPEVSGLAGRLFKLARGVTAGDVVQEVVLEGSRHWAEKEWDRTIGGTPGMIRIVKGVSLHAAAGSSGRSTLDRTLDSATDSWKAAKEMAPVIKNALDRFLE